MQDCRPKVMLELKLSLEIYIAGFSSGKEILKEAREKRELSSKKRRCCHIGINPLLMH